MKKIKASPQFVEDFEKVSRHYMMRDEPDEQYGNVHEHCKAVARRDIDAAMVSYAAMADEIDRGVI